MSTDNDPTDDLAVGPPVETTGAEPPAADATDPSPVVAPAPADDLWPTDPPKGVSLRLPSLVMGGLALAGLGFAGGAFTYKHEHPITAIITNGGPQAGDGVAGAGGQGRRQGQGGTARNGGAAGGGPGAGTTFGTVKTVDGGTIYVTDPSDNLIKITLPAGTTVNATRPGTAADVRPGDTIIVQGSVQPDGSTQAATVSVNPQAGGGFQRNAGTSGNNGAGAAPPTPGG